jgi:hypothetical protein
MQRLCGLPLLFTDHFAVGSILLSEWLQIEAVARLDSAICFQSHREKFLSLVSAPTVRLNDTNGEYQRWEGSALLHWATARGAKLQKVYMLGKGRGPLEKYLRECGSTVRQLDFPPNADQMSIMQLAFTAAKYCPNVTRLEIHCSLSADFIVVFPSFRSLAVFVCREAIHEVHLHALARFCTCLQELDIVAQTVETEALCCIGSLQVLQKLRVVKLDWTWRGHALTAIAQGCRHLVQITLAHVPPGCIYHFAECCASVELCSLTLNGSVTAAEMQALATHWTQLCDLYLLHDDGALKWTSALEEALVDLVLRCRSLSTLVCTELMHNELPSVGLRNERHLLPSTVIKTNEASLWRLWVKQLSAESLRSIAASCPRLCEVVHKTAVTEEFIGALSGTTVKSVGCPAIRVVGSALNKLSDLHGLRLWNIPGGQEKGLVAFCARLPNLRALDLHFAVRPELSVVPEILSTVPHLRLFSLQAVPPGGKRDENVTALLRTVALKLCPQVRLSSLDV